MQPVSFYFGSVDAQNFFLPNSQPYGCALAENFRVGVTGELLPRPRKELRETIPLPAGQTLINATFFFKEHIVFVTEDNTNTAYFYFYNTATTTTKAFKFAPKMAPTLPIVNEIRFMELSTNATFSVNPTITKADFSILMIFGSDKMYYIKDPAAPVIQEFLTDLTSTIMNPIDGVTAQGRLWVINTPDVTEPNRVWASQIGVPDSFKTITGSPAKTGFFLDIISERYELMYTITNSQDVLLITTSNGVRLVRSTNAAEGITAANAEQVLTSSLACDPILPVTFYSRFFIYSTPAGLFFKEVNMFEERGRGVQDQPVNFYKSFLGKVEKLFTSKRTASFYYELDGNLIAAGFIQNSTVPYAFNYTIYLPKVENVAVHHYFPDEGYLVRLLNETDVIIEQEFREQAPLVDEGRGYRLGLYYYQDTTNITLYVKIKGNDTNQIDNLDFYLDNASGTKLSKKIIFVDTDLHIEYRLSTLRKTENQKELYTTEMTLRVNPNVNLVCSIQSVVLS